MKKGDHALGCSSQGGSGVKRGGSGRGLRGAVVRESNGVGGGSEVYCSSLDRTRETPERGPGYRLL